jgi:hypothetical protein
VATTRAQAAFVDAAASPRVQFVLVAAAVIGLLIGIDTALLHLRLDPLADVHAYYDAGARLNAGLPLYEQSATTNEASFYRYPPLLAIAFRPLAMLPFDVAAFIWMVLLVACLVGTIWILGLRNRWTWLALGWLAAPVAWSLVVGQAQVAITLLMTVATPWGLALAAHLKVFPALAAAYWLGRREWSALMRFAIWMIGLTALSFVLEPGATRDYLTFLSLEQVGEVRNMSLYGISPALWAVSVAALGVVALVFARSQVGWIAAVSLSVLANPRLLMYQFMTLLAAVRPGPEKR